MYERISGLFVSFRLKICCTGEAFVYAIYAIITLVCTVSVQSRGVKIH